MCRHSPNGTSWKYVQQGISILQRSGTSVTEFLSTLYPTLSIEIKQLQQEGKAILLLLDANSDFNDRQFQDMISSLDLHNLHHSNPASLSYIGSANRRIDYMIGCIKIQNLTARAGTFSYTEGPQSDHRGLFVDIMVTELQS